MSILLSGDFHADEKKELQFIEKGALIRKYGQEIYDGIKYQIMLGDCGFEWVDNERGDKRIYKALAERPFPVLCVMGNHEPIYGKINKNETDIGIGEAVYKINTIPFVAYLKRGKVYNIDGIKFLVLGGALSIDRKFRKAGRTWWKEEYWDESEVQEMNKLLKSENSFDCVVSHTGPARLNNFLFLNTFNEDKFADEVAILNDDICSKIKFQEWFSGHWHVDKYHRDEIKNSGFHYLYQKTKILRKENNKIVLIEEFCH